MSHNGHRARLREKAEKESAELHEMLELLLFLALPRVNTNEIAHELLDRFGGIAGVLSTSVERLVTVNGIARASAVHLRNVANLIREYELSQCHTGELLKSQIELHKFLCALFACKCRETTYMLMFSKSKRFKGYKKIGEGTYTQNTVAVKQAVMYARSKGAESVIIAHNHPDMIAIPSNTDMETARKMNIAFGNAGIRVREHYVVADGRCVPYLSELATVCSDKPLKGDKKD